MTARRDRAPSYIVRRREVRNLHRPQLGIAAIAIAVCALMVAAAVAAERHRDLDIPKYTAAVLYEECGQRAPSVEKAHCNGFVHGFLVGALTGYDMPAWGLSSVAAARQ
jgi:hypothetical protein